MPDIENRELYEQRLTHEVRSLFFDWRSDLILAGKPIRLRIPQYRRQAIGDVITEAAREAASGVTGIFGIGFPVNDHDSLDSQIKQSVVDPIIELIEYKTNQGVREIAVENIGGGKNAVDLSVKSLSEKMTTKMFGDYLKIVFDRILSSNRAKMIGVTEITRAITHAENWMYRRWQHLKKTTVKIVTTAMAAAMATWLLSDRKEPRPDGLDIESGHDPDKSGQDGFINHPTNEDAPKNPDTPGSPTATGGAVADEEINTESPGKTFDPGIEIVPVWIIEDDGACPVCFRLNLKEAGDWGTFYSGPPAHPSCRCRVGYVKRKAKK